MLEYDDSIIIDKFQFDFVAEESETQSEIEKFGADFTIFDCSLVITDTETQEEYGTIKFPYQCNVRYVEPSAASALESIISDAYSYLSSRDEADFLEEFGYLESGQSALRGIKAYAACKAMYEQLINLLPNKEEDLQMIEERLSNREYEIDEPEMD